MKRFFSFVLAVLMCCSLLFTAVQPTVMAEDMSDNLSKLSAVLRREMDASSDDTGIPVGIILKGPSEEEIEALIAATYSGEKNTAAYRTAKKRAQNRLISAITSAFVKEYLDENDTLYYQGNILCVTAMVPKSKIMTIAALDEVTHIDLVSENDAPLEATVKEPENSAVLEKLSAVLRREMDASSDDTGIPVGIILKGPSEEEIEALIAATYSGEKNTAAYRTAKKRAQNRLISAITSAFVKEYLDENDTLYYQGNILCVTAMVPKSKIMTIAELDEVTHIDLVAENDFPLEATVEEPDDPAVLEKLSAVLRREMDASSDDTGIPVGIIFKGPNEEEVEALIAATYSGEKDTPAYRTAKKQAQHQLNSAITSAFVKEYLDENDTLYYQGYILCVTAMVPKSKIITIAALDEVTHIDLVAENDFPLEATEGNEPAGYDQPCSHDYKAVVTEPTCTERGYTTYTCTKCGNEYVGDEVPMLRHDWGEGAVTVEPTEETEGVRTYTCTRCGVTKTETIPVKEHVHAYTDVVTAPTCTEAGFTTHTCACGDSYVDSEVPALGHSFGEWTDSKAATCTEKGEQTRACTRCEAKETREIDALGHDFKDGVCTRCEAKDPDYEEPVVEPFRFDDVKDDKAFYFEPVYWAVEKGVTKGTSEKLFSPNEGCTRGQVVTFLWRAAGEPEPAGTKNPFRDIKETDYFYKAVAWAVEKGITKGISADKFSPDATCTRAQIVTFLYRAEGTPEIAKKSKPFHDVGEGQYYADAVAWAVENGVTTGKSADTFAPEATCTRAEVVTFLYRSYTGPKPQNPDTAGGPPVYYTASSVEELTQWIKTAEVEPSYTWGSLYPFLKAARDLGQILAVHPASEDYSLQEILVQCNREQMDYFFIKGNERLEVLVELPGTDGNPKLSLDERVGQINSDLALEYESLQYAKASATVNGKETDVYYYDGGEYTKKGSEQKELFGPSAFFEYEGHEVLIRGIGSLYGCKWDSTYLGLFQFDFVELE